jgi:hypothetical protein
MCRQAAGEVEVQVTNESAFSFPEARHRPKSRDRITELKSKIASAMSGAHWLLILSSRSVPR